MFLETDSLRDQGSCATGRRVAAIGLVLLLVLGSTVGADEGAPQQAPEGCYCVGTVGNVDCDYLDEISLRDLMTLIDHLFVSHRRLPNLEEANVDGDPAGEITMGDVVTLIDYLFVSQRTRVLPDCPKPFNNPPQTRIVGFVNGLSFLNSVEPYGPATGIRMRWEGSDILDNPYDPPPFEFEWKLFGPYTDAEYASLLDSFLVRVFITNDGQMLRFDSPPDTIGFDTIWNADSTVIISIWPVLFPTSLIVCDTTWLPGGTRVIDCDTILIDTLTGNNIYGVIDTLLMVFDTAFTNSQYNLLVQSSGDEAGDPWTTDLRDSLYDVYRYHPADTTQIERFIFAVRSRDEGLAPDLTPAWKSFTVINPQHERDIVVISWNNTADQNVAILSKVQAYWLVAIDNWINQTGRAGVVEYDPILDFKRAFNYTQNNSMLKLILKYKVAIVVQDAEVSASWSNQGQAAQNVMVGLQAGVNVWVAARVPLGNFPTGAPFDTAGVSQSYQYFFGVASYIFPGWSSGFYTVQDGDGLGLPRTEDFIGTLSLNENQWPALSVDTALLHSSYRWEGAIDPPHFPYRPFLPELGALPQVGWAQPTADAEVMYTYKSMYGPVHPMFPWLSFESLPVMHRLDRGYFRSVHSLFTPLALQASTAQVMVDSVLNWLYDMPIPVAGSALAPPEDLWKDFPDSEGGTDR